MLHSIANAGVGPVLGWVLRLVESRSPGALSSVALASFFPFRFHFPASLGSTVVTRFIATLDALTPARRFTGDGRLRLSMPRSRGVGQVCLFHVSGLVSVPSPPTPRS